jgi:hypothetical protein
MIKLPSRNHVYAQSHKRIFGTIPVGLLDDAGGEGGISSKALLFQVADPLSHTFVKTHFNSL